MQNLVTRFLKNESGATSIEYGLIAAGIAVAIVGTVYSIGGELSDMFSDVEKSPQDRPAPAE